MTIVIRIKKTSEINQTSKEDSSHSVILIWVQAMTSVETANVGKNFHHKRPKPFAGAGGEKKVCDLPS
jgi:hypothetical protein